MSTTDLSATPEDELLRRCQEDNEEAACLELDRRGVLPPVLEPDPVISDPAPLEAESH